jgi:hypothetical protein
MTGCDAVDRGFAQEQFGVKFMHQLGNVIAPPFTPFKPHAGKVGPEGEVSLVFPELSRLQGGNQLLILHSVKSVRKLRPQHRKCGATIKVSNAAAQSVFGVPKADW